MHRSELGGDRGGFRGGGGGRRWSPAGRGAKPGAGCHLQCVQESCVGAAELPDERRKVGFTSVGVDDD